MLLLHISDIHLKYPQCQTNQDPEFEFRQELVNHATCQASKLGDVDAILVTGDIAFKGMKEEYDVAVAWLEKLADAVGCNRHRLYVVPGNHDVDRNVFCTNTDARYAIEAIFNATDDQARERKLTSLLEEGSCAHNLFVSIANFNLFAARYDCQYGPDRLRWSTTLRIDRRTILRLHGLNSTLVSGINGNDDKGTLFMSALQLSVPRAPGTVNLVMAHHPPEWMSDQDDIETRLLGVPNILLFGHKHIQKVRRESDGPITLFAGSVNPDRRESGWDPAYNFIELKPLDSNSNRYVEVVVSQYHWQSNPNGFVPKINLGTGEPTFRHTIAVQGKNDAGDSETLVIQQEKGKDMEESTDLDLEGPSLAAPNVRDLIYRFWDLTKRQRDAVLKDLGIDIVETQSVSEPTAYREALVELAGRNRLNELQSAIAEKESTS